MIAIALKLKYRKVLYISSPKVKEGRGELRMDDGDGVMQ